MSFNQYQIGDVIQMKTSGGRESSEARFMLVVREIDACAISAVTLVEKTERNNWLTLVIREDRSEGSESGLSSDHVVGSLMTIRIMVEWIEAKIGSVPLALVKGIMS